MQLLQNLHSMPNSVNNREIYVFLFPSYTQSDFWMRKTHLALFREILFIDRSKSRIVFLDSEYYFLSKERYFKMHLKNCIEYGPEELYIILDDPERKRLETYSTD